MRKAAGGLNIRRLPFVIYNPPTRAGGLFFGLTVPVFAKVAINYGN